MKKTFTFILFSFLTVFNLHAASFTPGNIVVVRIGDGSIALTNASALVFLDEYTPAGVLVQSIQLPTTLSGSNRRFVVSGTATSEGNLTLSGDKRYLTLGGYDTTTGIASVAGVAGIPRDIALVDYNGNINTSTYFSDGFTVSSIRGTYTLDGSYFWAAGTSTGTAGCVRYITLGGTSSVQVSSTANNSRFVYAYNNQLYVSSGSGAFTGVNQVGTGLPIVTGTVITNLINTVTGSSPYGFAFSPDGNTCYVADDRTIASSGGLQKWTYNGSAWSLAYLLNSGISTGCRSLAVNFSGSNPVIYTSNNTQLATVTDAGASSTFTVLTTAVTNTVFRGIAFAPSLAAPTAPSLVSPANNSTGNPTSLTLIWNKSANATSYRVQVATDSLFNSIIVNDSTLTDSTKSISGLSDNTSYWWRVNAKNGGGTSAYSTSYKFSTNAAVPPPPLLVSPADNSVGNLTSLTLVWNKSLNATSYRIQLSSDSLFNALIVNDSTLTDSTRAISGLNPLVSYWWRVNAKSSGGTSAYSLTYKFRTLGVPAQITGTFVPANGATNQPTTINFKWSRAFDQTLSKILNSPVNLIRRQFQTIGLN